MCDVCVAQALCLKVWWDFRCEWGWHLGCVELRKIEILNRGHLVLSLAISQTLKGPAARSSRSY